MAEPIKLPSIYQNIQAPAGANPQDVQATKDQMAMQFAPQENSITNTINTLNQFLERDISAQQQYGTNADQRISQIGSEVAEKLQGNVGAIGNIFEQGGQQLGSIYDKGIADVQGTGKSAIDRVTASANALGQGQALKADPYGTDPISRMMATQAIGESRLQGSKAGSQGTLATLGASLKGIAQKAVGDSVRDYGQKRADVATQVLKVIGQLQSTTNVGIMEQLQKFSDLAETEGPTFRTMLTAATSARSTAQQKAANDAFEQALKIGKFNQAQSKIDQDNDPNSLDNQLKSINIAKGMKSLDGSEDVNYISESEGQSNLQSFLEQTRRSGGGGPSGLSGTSVVGIQNWINENLGSSKMTGIYNTADAGQILSSLAQTQSKKGLVELPITEGSKHTNRAKGDYVVDLPTLLNAIQARFQNVGPSSKTGTKI